MPYNITKSNGTAHVVNDLVIDYTYTAALLGRDSTNFGQSVAQDNLRHLENFSNTVPPRGAIKGQLWFNSANNVLMQYIGADPVGPNDNNSVALTHWQAVGSDFTNITSDLLPSTDATKNIGSATKRFHRIYGVHGIFNSSSDPNTDGTIALQVTGDATIAAGTFYPTNPDAINLGKTDKTWNEVWVNTAKVTNLLTLGANTNPVSLTSDAFVPNTILPDGIVNLGKNAQRFASLYVNSVDAASLFVGSGGLTSNLVPSTNITFDLGSSAKKFNNVYANNFVENGVPLSTKYIQAGQPSTTFSGDIVLQASPPNSDSPQFIAKDNVNNTLAYFDVAGEAARIVGSYRGGVAKPLLYIDINSNDLVTYGDVITNKLRLKPNTNAAGEVVVQIAPDGKVYFGIGSRSSVILGNVPALGYDYGAGLKTVWHSGLMGHGSGLDADTVDGYHLGDLDARYINTSGDTMGGYLTLNANPSAGLHAAPKQYVDSAVAGMSGSLNSKVSKTGDTMTGSLNMSGLQINGLGQPSSAGDATNKDYVDSLVNWWSGGGYSSISQNGILLFSSGLMMQWGNYNLAAGPNNQTVPFNGTFTAVYSIQLTNRENYSNEGNFIRILYHTGTNFAISNGNGNTYTTYDWFAIGRYN
jgi:hypothetical protein